MDTGYHRPPKRAVLSGSSSTFNTPSPEFCGRKDTMIQPYRFFLPVLIPPLVEIEDRLMDRSPPSYYQSKFFLNRPVRVARRNVPYGEKNKHCLISIRRLFYSTYSSRVFASYPRWRRLASVIRTAACGDGERILDVTESPRALLSRSSSTFNTPSSEFYGRKDTMIQPYPFFQSLSLL